MALSNKERIGRMLDGLAAGLGPVVEQAFAKAYGPTWVSTVEEGKGAGTASSDPSDPQFLLNALWFHWQDTLGKTLGQAERNYVAELRLTRNRWAHAGEKPFSGDDVYRAYDTAERLLRSVASPVADELAKAKAQVLMRTRSPRRGRSRRRPRPPRSPRNRWRDSPPGAASSPPTPMWPPAATARPSLRPTSRKSREGRVPASTSTRASSSPAPTSPRASAYSSRVP